MLANLDSKSLRAAVLALAALGALMLLGALGLAAQAWRQQARLGAELALLRAERADDQDALRAAAEHAEAARTRLDALEQRTALLEARAAASFPVAELQNSRDEGVYLEVERLVTLAAQELQVGGAVATASAALQGADARLARVNRPQFVELRRALARDLERLHNAPTVDLAGIAIRLDQLQQAVDGWPLLADPLPRPSSDAAPRPAAALSAVDNRAVADAHHAPAAPGAAAQAAARIAQLRTWLEQQFGALLQIRSIATPEALLVDDQQQSLVRERLRLHLLGARLALLAHDERLFRADLAEAQGLVARYFDGRNPALVAAQAQLRLLASTPIVVDVPAIADSVGALRALRGGANR